LIAYQVANEFQVEIRNAAAVHEVQPLRRMAKETIRSSPARRVLFGDKLETRRRSEQVSVILPLRSGILTAASERKQQQKGP
jgi:hypothetical protein